MYTIILLRLKLLTLEVLIVIC